MIKNVVRGIWAGSMVLSVLGLLLASFASTSPLLHGLIHSTHSHSTKGDSFHNHENHALHASSSEVAGCGHHTSEKEPVESHDSHSEDSHTCLVNFIQNGSLECGTYLIPGTEFPPDRNLQVTWRNQSDLSSIYPSSIKGRAPPVTSGLA